MKLALLVLGSVALTASLADIGQETPRIVVGPVLQAATPDSMTVMWETTGPSEETVVDWGESEALGRADMGTVTRRKVEERVIHHATISGLKAGRRYFYAVRTGALRSTLADFRTPPAKGSRAPFRFAVYSDCQQGPGVHERIVRQSVVPELQKGLAFALVAGDIVQDGDVYAQYQERFFGPIAPAARHVPFYTAIGNHEKNDPAYFDYLALPRNGTPGKEEHWYSFEYANAHVIGLDTNGAYSTDEQLAWLDEDLARTCRDADVDYVFAFFHHPWKSELWVPGEHWYAGKIVERLEAHLRACGKQGAYFFGHTHGYSRGQSRDADLYHVNVGTAGGHIDHWDEHEQRDYELFQKSFDEYGALIVEVNGDEGGGFRGWRKTYGDETDVKNGEVQDEFFLARRNRAPSTPTMTAARARVEGGEMRVDLASTPLVDPDGHAWLEAEWQVAPTADGFGAATVSKWTRFENWFRDVDTNAGMAMDRTTVTLPAGKGPWVARVRQRDFGLAWSAWSEPVAVSP